MRLVLCLPRYQYLYLYPFLPDSLLPLTKPQAQPSSSTSVWYPSFTHLGVVARTMDSSPTTSPSTSRFFSTFPSGPPKRTYARTRGAQTRTRPSGSDNLDGDEEESTNTQSSSQRQAIRKTSPRSSPTPVAQRSSSRANSSASRPGTQISTRSSARSRVTVPADGPSAGEEGWGAEIVAEQASSSQLNANVAEDDLANQELKRKGEKKRKRGGIVVPSSSLLPGRTTRSGTNIAASVTISEEIERPHTPPPQTSGSDVTSSARRVPRTPPRSVRPAAPTTPTSSSPRDFAGLFAAVSPGGTLERSTIASPRAARILGKSQSSGAVLDSPSKLKQRFESIQRQDSFGSSMSAGPSTPSKRLGKTQSMPVTPSHSSPVRTETTSDPSAMLLQASVPEGQGSGGRAKRIYGRTRTVVAEEEEASQEAQTLEDTLAKESYADLRKRYEVDSGSAEVAADLLSVGRPEICFGRG